MPDSHANFGASTVATAPVSATAGTSLVVTAGQGALFSTPPFNAVVCPAGTAPSALNAEIVRVTAIATDTLTITRGPQAGDPGGINRSILVGDQIFEAVTAKTMTDVESQLAVPVTTAVAMTAVPGQPIFATAAVPIALPPAPAQGARVQVVAAGGAVTINRGGTTDTIFSYGAAGLTSLTLINGTNVDLRYLGTVWYVVAGAPQGYAPWLQLPSTQRLLFQAGAGLIAHPGGGQVALQVALPTAWSTAHVAFVGSTWPQASYTGFATYGAESNGLTAGQVSVASTPAQNVNVSWMSVGY